MRYSDIPTLKDWRAESKWVAPNNANGANGLAGQDLRMFNIEKLVAQYHAVMPMAKYHTLLDLKKEVSDWLGSITTVTKASQFQAQVTQKAAVQVLEEVVDRRLKTYPPRKYDEVVLAGYVIRTSKAKALANNDFTVGYVGLADPTSDIETRCQQMISAIQKSVFQYQTTFLTAPKKVRDDRKTLKLFMAPEFYFRGAAGAYTVDRMSGAHGGKSVLDRLREETCKHPDWLFVLGTFACASEYNKIVCWNVGSHANQKGAFAERAPAQKVIACQTCKKELLCDACKKGLTVFKPGTNPPEYWDDERSFCCPACQKKSAFREVVFAFVIDNYAMVQKGGFSEGDGIHDYCMQKENISPVDFEKVPNGQNFPLVNVFNLSRAVVGTPIGGDQERMGGGVFTMDGITFGMEICLDHHKKRLKSSRDAKNIQIQLIPAAGIDIVANSVACLPQGLVFLVDGSKSKAVVQVNGKAAAENAQATVAVPNCANGCFPNAANQKIDLFGPFNIAYP